MKAYLNVAYNTPLELFESNSNSFEELVDDFLKSKKIEEDQIASIEITDIRDLDDDGLPLVEVWTDLIKLKGN